MVAGQPQVIKIVHTGTKGPRFATGASVIRSGVIKSNSSTPVRKIFTDDDNVVSINLFFTNCFCSYLNDLHR